MVGRIWWTRGVRRALRWLSPLVVVGVSLCLATPVPAQPGSANPTPADSSTTSVPGAGAPASTEPLGPGREAAPSTTTVPAESTPPGETTAVPGDVAGEASEGSYGGQPAFDPSSNQPSPSVVAAASSGVAEAWRRYDRSVGILASLSTRLDVATADAGAVGTARRQAIGDAAAARNRMRRRAVAAFIRGDRRLALLNVLADPVELSRGRVYLETLARDDHRAALAYRRAAARLDEAGLRLAEELAGLQARVSVATAERDRSALALADARQCDVAARLGTRLCVAGFTFPVVGPVNFINSWGYARMPGTGQSHWHEGTDIMAPSGRELVAVEDGTLFKVGTAGLGGMRVWLHGASGTDYYYAHLSAFGPGVVDGLAVTVGQVVGFVGSTGNAAGGASHVHFEIHPGGGRPINPFPLLRAAYGDQPMPSQARAEAGIASMVPVVAPEEEADDPAAGAGPDAGTPRVPGGG
ncbi:MAG: peptidoglycan DD-metalloendopeptidase family protein [Microthrixaceae bacterium]